MGANGVCELLVALLVAAGGALGDGVSGVWIQWLQGNGCGRLLDLGSGVLTAFGLRQVAHKLCRTGPTDDNGLEIGKPLPRGQMRGSADTSSSAFSVVTRGTSGLQCSHLSSFISSFSIDSLKTGLGMWCGEDAFAWSVLHSKPQSEAAHLGNDGTIRCLDRTNSALTCERSPQLGLLILDFPYKRRGQGQSRDPHLSTKLLPCPTVCSSVLIVRGIREQLE